MGTEPLLSPFAMLSRRLEKAVISELRSVTLLRWRIPQPPSFSLILLPQSSNGRNRVKFNERQ